MNNTGYRDEPLSFSNHEINLTSVSQVRALLSELGIRPSKALGQNFLIDRNILDIVINTLDLSPGDRILEVGPGLGVVTERLLEKAGRVVAVEKDRRLFQFLKRELRSGETFELICGDALETGVERLRAGEINKVVSNLPYSSGSRILVEMMKLASPPAMIVVMVQQEVAQRLTARPGTRDYGVMAIWGGINYHVAPVKTVRRTCFWPRPEVESVVVKMTRRHGVALKPGERALFFFLTKTAFMHRRKQLATILDHARFGANMIQGGVEELLNQAAIEPRARPADLEIEDWLRLSRVCMEKGAGGEKVIGDRC